MAGTVAAPGGCGTALGNNQPPAAALHGLPPLPHSPPVPHPPPKTPRPALHGLTVLERGWLSSNNVLLHDAEQGAMLVDSSHVLHAPQTLALVRQALGGQALRGVVNTHLHSDHCGGNATLQRELDARITVPQRSWLAAREWDEQALSYRDTAQRCERFTPDAAIAPGEVLRVGGRRWQALAAPGHDPDSIVLFDADEGVLISADALWENGFGVVFPELRGEPGFDDVAAVLHLIASLDARCVIPGHGAPFGEVAGALQRAHQRLAYMRADPLRHARHALKVLTKYHLMEERCQHGPEFMAWFCAAPLCEAVWQRLQRPEGSLARFGERLVEELVRGGALQWRDGVLHDA